jgi:protein-S-isoprenylcysteine O-methyltransferase Ste14
LSASFLLFVALFLVGLTIRGAYERLRKARKVEEGNRRAFLVVLAGMAMLWIGWFAMCPQDPVPLPVPDAGRWAGLGLVILGWVLALGALGQLRGVENIDHLVTTGLFARLRHPMYTGFVLWIVGWATFHGAAASLLPGLLGIASVQHWRHLEELKLESTYGDAYRDYRRSTWF